MRVNTQINWTAFFKSLPRGILLFEVVRPYKALDLLSASSHSVGCANTAFTQRAVWLKNLSVLPGCGWIDRLSLSNCLMQQLKLEKQKLSLFFSKLYVFINIAWFKRSFFHTFISFIITGIYYIAQSTETRLHNLCGDILSSEFLPQNLWCVHDMPSIVHILNYIKTLYM